MHGGGGGWWSYISRDEDQRKPTFSLPVLRRVAGDSNVVLAPPIMGAEDFSEFQKKIPGFFFFLGVTPRDRDPSKVPTNHSPFFFADEGALPVGVGALTHLTLDWLARNRAR